MRRTKIVATIGPATYQPERIRELLDAGMDMARLNGSHNELDWHAATIETIRDIAPATPVLLDLPGRKIRTAQLAHEPDFAKNETIILTTEPGHDGTEKVSISYPFLHQQVEAGDRIFADDGTIAFTVLETRGPDVHCRAEAAGKLRSRKGINVPGISLKADLVNDADRELLVFACENEVDYLGISFVESAAHIQNVRDLIGAKIPRIVSKIENLNGLKNMTEIIRGSDAIMIDRGDLSIETNPDNVTLFQKRILCSAKDWGTPVIVATEMMHSMIKSPVPTKAEVSDITNAVLDGCAATMLSGETAIGQHPIEAVTLMARIAEQSSAFYDSEVSQSLETNAQMPPENNTVPRAMENAIALICQSLPITKIVAVTKSGFAARMIAARAPAQPILAVTNDQMAARSFNLLPGTRGIYVELAFSRTSTDHIPTCLKSLWLRNEIVEDDLILVTAVGYPKSGNRMNLVQTHYVADLIQSMEWRK